MLWTTNELAAVGQLMPADAVENIRGISIDSRQIGPGDLFIALSGDPGPRFKGGVENPQDGHDYIDAAVAGGAGAVLLSRKPDGLSVPCIQVTDTLDGLWDLAGLGRARCTGQIVAVTGSAGKTTAKSWLLDLLERQCQVHGSVGSLNNHWGVPLTLGRMPRDTDVGVIEIGTNHPGEIGPLSQLAKPDIAVLLNVLPAHIGNFESLAALQAEKRAIADGLTEAGKFILPYGLRSGAAQEVTFGFEPEADASGVYKVFDGTWMVKANILGETLEYELAEGGEHRVLTSLAVLAVVATLGYSVSQAAQAMIQLDSPRGRGNQSVVNGITVIDDSYNANPVSMKYAIDGLKGAGRKIAILGEMLELGEDGHRYHQDVAKLFPDLDLVITVGEGFNKSPGTSHYQSVAEIDLESLAANLQPGDQVLIKGSNKVFWQHNFVNQLLAALA